MKNSGLVPHVICYYDDSLEDEIGGERGTQRREIRTVFLSQKNKTAQVT